MRTILYVEDNPDHAELVMETLTEQGEFPIHHVEDGEAALAWLSSARPTLVLLDLRLPKIGGLQVLQRMRSEPGMRNIPVVVLTTSAADADLELAYAHGANAYLVKPTNFEQFEALLSTLHAFWLSWNRLPAIP